MLHKLLLALFIVSCAPVGLVGCKKDKTEDSAKAKKSDDDDDDKGSSKKKKSKGDDDDGSESKSKKKSKGDDDDSTSGADEDSTGVKACDDYLARFMKCMPGDKRIKADTVKKMREGWKTAAASPNGKDVVKDACKAADTSLDRVPGCM